MVRLLWQLTYEMENSDFNSDFLRKHNLVEKTSGDNLEEKSEVEPLMAV